MPDVTTVDHRVKAGQVRDWLATVQASEDLVSVGAYVPGSNPRIDEALGEARRHRGVPASRRSDDLQPFDAAVRRLREL